MICLRIAHRVESLLGALLSYHSCIFFIKPVMASEDEPRERLPTGGDGTANWVAVQKQTFTAWVNDRLKSGKVDKVVEDLKTQFADGITLIKLLEVLAPTKKMLK